MLTSLTNAFSPADAATIYSEKYYGMSTYKDLTYWMNACLSARSQVSGSGSGTESYTVLKAHFATVGVTISDAQMDQIVGNGSTMLTMVDTLETRLVENSSKAGYDFLSAPIKPSPLALTQWTQHSILGNNVDFWLSGSNEKQQVSFADVSSMKDLGMNFNVPPEFEPKGEITVD